MTRTLGLGICLAMYWVVEMALLTTGVLPKIADFGISRFPLIIGRLRNSPLERVIAVRNRPRKATSRRDQLAYVNCASKSRNEHFLEAAARENGLKRLYVSAGLQNLEAPPEIN
jgi:hypothetical protein